MIAAALLSFGFLYSQAMILREAKGIPAWRTATIVPLVTITGLAEGVGLLLTLLAAVAPADRLAVAVAVLALTLSAARVGVWHAYLTGLARGGEPGRTLSVLRAFAPWFYAGSLALPFVLIVLGFAVPGLVAPAFILAGLLMAGVGGALKFVIVARAGFNQGFALEHTPVRGSGRADPAVKPGWLLPRQPTMEGGVRP